MTTILPLEFDLGPFTLPVAQGFSLYEGTDTIRLAITVECENGLPAVVFIPVPRAMLPDIIKGLSSVAQPG
jgi:hypothetical protein